MEEETKSLTEQVKEMKEIINSGKIKKLRIPSKAKVGRGKLKKGWISIFRIGENGNITPTKVQIDGGVFDFLKKGGSYHATTGREILFWKGKPVIFQEDKKVNPKLFTFNDGDNQTYGQKNIIAAILRDTIKVKKTGANWGLLIVIGIIIYVLGKYVFKFF